MLGFWNCCRCTTLLHGLHFLPSFLVPTLPEYSYMNSWVATCRGPCLTLICFWNDVICKLNTWCLCCQLYCANSSCLQLKGKVDSSVHCLAQTMDDNLTARVQELLAPVLLGLEVCFFWDIHIIRSKGESGCEFTMKEDKMVEKSLAKKNQITLPVIVFIITQKWVLWFLPLRFSLDPGKSSISCTTKKV